MRAPVPTGWLKNDALTPNMSEKASFSAPASLNGNPLRFDEAAVTPCVSSWATTSSAAANGFTSMLGPTYPSGAPSPSVIAPLPSGPQVEQKNAFR